MSIDHSRRSFLVKSTTILVAGTLLPQVSFAKTKAVKAASPVKRLTLYNTHTGEWFKGAYKFHNQYVPEALTALNKLLRDWRTDQIHPIDPRLLDLIFDLQKGLGVTQPFDVISGYRSPKTNAMLCESSHGVAKKSLHVSGAAIDIRLPRRLRHLRDLARSFKRGGVGYYPSSGFVHVDVRPKPVYWGAA